MLGLDVQVQDVDFHAEDMLKADLQGTAVLMLTSLCWNEHLCTAAAQKIRAELPAGSLVVDYTNRLDSVLTCAIKLQVAVSWNNEQTMYVYIKQG